MKLLHDFIRLRAAGRRLLSGGHCDSRSRGYAVTVPLPLDQSGSGPDRCKVHAAADVHASDSAMPPSPGKLRLVAGH